MATSDLDDSWLRTWVEHVSVSYSPLLKSQNYYGITEGIYVRTSAEVLVNLKCEMTKNKEEKA